MYDNELVRCRIINIE